MLVSSQIASNAPQYINKPISKTFQAIFRMSQILPETRSFNRFMVKSFNIFCETQPLTPKFIFLSSYDWFTTVGWHLIAYALRAIFPNSQDITKLKFENV